MRITNVKVHFMRIPLREPGLLHPHQPTRKSWDFTLVKVFTDQDVTGFGAMERWAPGWSRYVEHVMKPLLVDVIAEPHYIERFAATIRSQAPSRVSPRPSCIEIALWDIVGKAAGQPVYKLLGAYQDKAKAYLSSWDEYRWTPKEWAEFSIKNREQGFRAIKLYCSPLTPLKKELDKVKAVRDAIGDEMEIMVDAESAWGLSSYSYRDALKLARGLERLDVVWVEEPLPHLHNPDLSARLAAAVDIQIAGGGQIFGMHDFRMLLEKKALDIVQPDVGNVGGISEMRKVALLAEAYGRSCVPHCYGSGLLLAATLQVVGSTNIPYVEYTSFPPVFGVDVRDSILENPILVDKDGYVSVPRQPGLGVGINEENVEKYSVKDEDIL